MTIITSNYPILPPSGSAPSLQEALPPFPMVPPGTKAVDLLALYVPSFSSLPKEKQKVIIEYVRRLHKPELLKVLTEIEKLPPLYEAELEAIRTLDTAHPIFQNPSLQEHAFKAFVSGSLTVDEVSQLFIHDVCVHTPGTLVRPLAEAKDWIKRGVTGYFFDGAEELFLNHPDLQKEKIYLVKLDYDYDNPDKNIVTRIHFNVDYNFLIVSLKEEYYYIVLTPRLLSHLFYQSCEHQGRLKFNPVLGPSVSAENFQNPNKRDALVPCRLFPESQPKEADKYPATPLEFWYHDTAYHGFLLHKNPRRKAFIELANLFQGTVSSIQKFRRALLDQDTPLYARRYHHTDHFLVTLSNYWNANFEDEDQKKISGQKLCDYIRTHRSRWEKDYFLDLNNFEQVFEPQTT